MATYDTTENKFPGLVELDVLRLTVIVDNEVDNMSSVPKELGLTTQQQSLFKDHRRLDKDRSTVTVPPTSGGHTHAHTHATEDGKDDASKRGMTTVNYDFSDVCCGAHGLSVLLTGVKDGKEHKVLFDTGPHSAIFLENAKRLEIEFEKIDVIVLSHWHIDHSGGMLAAVERCQHARRQQQQQSASSVVVDLHPDRPDERGACLTKPSPPGSTAPLEPIEYVAWGKEPSFPALESAGGQVSLNAKAHTICENYFGVSGTIPRRTTYETGIPNHVRWSDASKSWSSEPEIMDERYLVARVRGKGLVVLTGCSHAGVINVCQDVQRAFGPAEDNGGDKIFFVAGGFHLAGSSMETRIQETVKDMKVINPAFMAPGHCSGWRAKSALENAMIGQVVSLGVGSDFCIAQEHI
ncbi:hypothetical protein BGZ96_002546 [Linnemannia gamsii]|uniref:Metallo-beta-lactamase domain-containing protein n=1 Tax=Linnemannia gamsii TaxID=64522 RepID=A0ABQ7JKZ7_9FUNG|nr:hypothetical protein BGZ96_002546 [Linnemannia gamsii]